MSNTEELGIRLSATGVPETTAGLSLAGKTVEELGEKAEAASRPVAQATARLGGMGKTAKETQAAFRLLPAQITDVVTSLASGQPAWLVAIQQGGQIKDSFGGIGPAIRAITSAITPARLAMGGTAAVVGALALAYHQATSEQQAYTRGLALTANATGTTSDALGVMANRIAATIGTQGKAAEALAMLVSTGEVGAANLERFSQTAIRMERDLAIPLERTADAFTDLGRAPLEASLRLNRGLNYLTGSMYDQIRALTVQGRLTEAASLAQEAYAAAMESRARKVEEGLGGLDRAWRSIASAAREGWDAMVGALRAPSVIEQIKAIDQQLSDFEAARQKPGVRFYGVFADAQARDEQALRERRAALNRTLLNETEAAQADAAKVEQAKRELREREASMMEAAVALELAQARAAATEREAIVARDIASAQSAGSRRESLVRAETATLDSLRDRDAVGLADYYERKAALEKRALASQITVVDAQISAERRLAQSRASVVDAEIAAEARRKPVNEEGGAVQQARLIELRARRGEIEVQQQARLIELGAQRAELVAQQGAAEVAAQRAVETGSAEALQRFIDDVNQRRQSLTQFSEQLRSSNAQNAAELIADPYKRAAALAQLQIEELTRYTADQLAGLKSRLPSLDIAQPEAAAAVRAEILAAEQRKADAIVLINARLTEELKPEWQRMLEAWSDTTRAMREAYDEFQSGWLREGENAWVQFVQTGKLNMRSLSNFVLGEYAKMVWKSSLAPSFASAGSWIASLFGFHSGGVGTAEASFTRPVMAGLPRFHTGIGPDEVPAVIQRSEGVFTKGQMAAMAPVDQIAKAMNGNTIHFSPVIQIDSRTDRAEVYALVSRAMDAAQAQLLEKMDRNMV